jgi:hypothetical protein
VKDESAENNSALSLFDVYAANRSSRIYASGTLPWSHLFVAQLLAPVGEMCYDNSGCEVIAKRHGYDGGHRQDRQQAERCTDGVLCPWDGCAVVCMADHVVQ